jgi:hypothetical protein
MMKRRIRKFITGIMLTALLTSSLSVPVFADGASETSRSQSAVSSTSIGRVNLNQNSYFEISDVNMISTVSGKTVAFKVTVHNNGTSDIDMIDYWVNLRNKSGAKSTVYLVKDDNPSERVPAASTRTFTYYSNVSGSVQLSDLRFEIIRWDFTQPNFERSLGTVSVPASYKPETPVDRKRNLNVNNTDVLAYIDRVSVNKSDKYHRPSITIYFENTGTQSFNVPAYEFKIVTAEGLVYPLTARGINNLVLNPKVKEDIQLTGAIPVEVDPNGWKLVIAQPVAEAKIAIPIAAFDLPSASQQEGGAIGQEYLFSASTGDYYVTMNSLHRLPLENEDLLTADFTIVNKSDETLSIPVFMGQFVLDDKVEVEAQAVLPDKVIGITPNSKISLQLYAEIPYTYDFSRIKAVLREKDEDNQVVDLIEFTHGSELSRIRTIAFGTKHNLDVIGNRSNVSVREINTYEGPTANIVSVEMLAENLEKRFTSVATLNAHFETPDGLVYPASVEIPEEKVAPGGKGVINFWRELPKTIDTSTLSLVVGEAVTGNDGKPTAYYVNPVGFTLPEEDRSVASQFTNIDIYPYTLSLSKIRTQINYESWRMLVTFDYELSKDLLVQKNTTDHRIVLELKDEENNLTISGEYSLVDGTNPDTTLKIGKHQGKLEVTDPDLIFKIRTMREHDLNVYYQIKPDQRKLLASKKVRWFTVND